MFDNPENFESACIVNGAHGVYVPQCFAESYEADQWGLDEESDDWQILLVGPDHEHYWDAWDAILSSAKTVDGWYLLQDGDLFAIREIQTETDEV